MEEAIDRTPEQRIGWNSMTPGGRTRLLMAVPIADPSSHRAKYALAIARAARAKNWLIDLAIPQTETTHSTATELIDAVTESGGQALDIPTPRSRLNGRLGLVEGQLRCWLFLRDAARQAARLRQHDLAYVTDGDLWYLSCAALGSPIKRIPIFTVMLRVRYHHELLGHNAACRSRYGAFQRFAVESILKKEAIHGILTPEKALATHHSTRLPRLSRRLQYVPDMGQKVRLVPRGDARNSLGIQTARPLIACFGVEERKGVPELLAGLQKVEGPHAPAALLVGRSDAVTAELLTSPSIRRLRESGRLWLRMGAFSENELNLGLASADGVWLGYKSHPFSSSILWEAAQAGLPVIGCDKGIIAWEIRENGLGLTTRIDDPSDVASALIRLFSESAPRETWRGNALKAGAAHTPDRFGEGVLKIMQELMCHAVLEGPSALEKGHTRTSTDCR